MTDWSDEDLSAFLDGALDEPAARALEADLRADLGLRARLDGLRAVDAAAREAFGAPMDAPIPDRLRRLVEEARPEALATAEIVQLQPRRSARSANAGFDWRIAAAAALALGVGLVGGASLNGPSTHDMLRADATAIERSNPLFALLEETPSAQTVALAGGDAFKPVLSFAAADGRLCREFELASEEASSVGVACRNSDAWRMEILLAADDRPEGAEGYVQASGFNEAALDAALQSLGAGAPLSVDAEADHIREGWSRP